MIPAGNNALADQLGVHPLIRPVDRTIIDVLVVREDIERMRELHKKQDLTKEDWQELSHLLTSTEPKLLNLEPELMYKFSQFFIGVSAFTSQSGSYSFAFEKIMQRKKDGKIPISDKLISNFTESRGRMDRSTKQLQGIFSYSGKVTLSNKGLAFKEFIRSETELGFPKYQQYPQVQNNPAPQQRGF